MKAIIKTEKSSHDEVSAPLWDSQMKRIVTSMGKYTKRLASTFLSLTILINGGVDYSQSLASSTSDSIVSVESEVLNVNVGTGGNIASSSAISGGDTAETPETKAPESVATSVPTSSASDVVQTIINKSKKKVIPLATRKTAKKTTVRKRKLIKLKKTGYVNVDGANVRKKASKKSKVVTTFRFNKKVKYATYSKKWVVTKYKGKYVYIAKSVLSKTKAKYTVKKVIGASGRMKSFESYRAITSTGSPQYRLQQKAHTSENGIRSVDGRYCVALGSYYTTKIGTKVDLILDNGEVIRCVLGDQKADKDTHCQHAVHYDGSVAEFLVSTSQLPRRARQMGNCSYADEDWNSGIDKIRVYKEEE